MDFLSLFSSLINLVLSIFSFDFQFGFVHISFWGIFILGSLLCIAGFFIGKLMK